MWIYFSKKQEAYAFYQEVASEHKRWIVSELADGYRVDLEQPSHQKETMIEVMEACFTLIMDRRWFGWMEWVLRHKFHYKEDHEIERILEIAHEFKHEEIKGVELPPVHSLLKRGIQHFLVGKKDFHFDELAVVCLKKISKTLTEYTGLVLDEYKQEEAYQLLVDSWRFRVHHQDTGVRCLHVLEKGSMRYFHAEGNPISESETELYLKQYPDDSIVNLPLGWNLTPALVHAPDEIIIYSDKNDDSAIELLLNIFEEKASLKPRSHFPFKIS